MRVAGKVEIEFDAPRSSQGMIVRTSRDRTPLYKTAGLVVLLVAAFALALPWLQFRGDFLPRTHVTMMSARAGLSMDPGA